MALGFASALASAGMEVAHGVVTIGYDDTAVDAGLARTEATTRRASGASSKAILGFGAAAAVAFAEGGKMAVDFDKKMRLIQTSAGGTSRDVRVLSKDILDLAASGNSPQGPEELATAMYHLKSLGLDNATAMGVLKSAISGTEVGLSNLEGTTNALGAAVRVGISGTENYSQAMATLAGITGAGNMRMDDLVAALSTGVLPTFKAVGLSLSDFGAGLATMTDEAVPANEAATRLRMTLQLVAATTPKAQKQLAAIGIGADDLGRALRSGPHGLLNMLTLLHDKLGAIQDPTERFALLARAFGARSSGALIMLLNNLDIVRQKYGQIEKSASRFDQNVKTAQVSTANQLEEAWSRVQAALIGLGKLILPVITLLAQMVGTIATLAGKLGFLKPLLAAVAATFALIQLKALASWAAMKLVALGATEMAATTVAATTAADAGFAAMGTWIERDGGLLLVLNSELEAMGPAAVAGGTVAETELVGVGAAAQGATARVGLLRGALAGLAGLGIAGAAIGLSKIVNDARKDIHNNSRDFKAEHIISTDKSGGAIYVKGGHVFSRTIPFAGGPIQTYDITKTAEGRKILRDFLLKQEGDRLRKSDHPAGSINRSAGFGGKAEPFIVKGAKPDIKTLQLANRISIQESKAALTKTQKDDREAFLAEEAFWRWILRSRKLTGQQRANAWANLAAADSQVQSIDAAGASAVSKSAKARAKATKARQKDLTELDSSIALAEAKARTTKGTGDDLRAAKQEEAYWRKQIGYVKEHVKAAQKREQILTSLYNSLADSIQKVADAKKASEDKASRAAQIEAMAYLKTRGSFFAQFAPNIFGGEPGRMTLGSTTKAHGVTVHHTEVNVTQNIKKDQPTSVDMRQARQAARHAFG